MILDTVSSMNQGVLRYLGRGEKREVPAIAAPGSVADPYLGQGSHPDIVQRVWDELGAVLPGACRCLVHGTPALVHDRTGIVIAVCNGTQYNLRLTEADFHSATARGAVTRIRWSTGEEMDSLAVLGVGWVFGGWFKEETEWCRDTYEAQAAGNGSGPLTATGGSSAPRQ
jgi:hypothetical protein